MTAFELVLKMHVTILFLTLLTNFDYFRCEKGFTSNKYVVLCIPDSDAKEIKRKLVNGLGIVVADHIERTLIESFG